MQFVSLKMVGFVFRVICTFYFVQRILIFNKWLITVEQLNLGILANFSFYSSTMLEIIFSFKFLFFLCSIVTYI